MPILGGAAIPTKQQVELGVLCDLLRALKIRPDRPPRPGDPNSNEPDLIVVLGDRSVGVEVTQAFYSDKHARWEWEGPRGNLDAGVSPLISNPDRKLCEFVQKVLNEKCARKPYGGAAECWLCVAVRGENSDSGDIERVARAVRVPETRTFARIYLTHWEPVGGVGCALYRLE